MVSLFFLLTVLIITFINPIFTSALSQPSTPPPPPMFMPTTPSTVPPGLSLSAMIFPQTFGLYLVEIGVGTSPINQHMVMDTRSDHTWFKCKPCNCLKIPHLFDPLLSTSTAVVPCDFPACNHFGCNNNQCMYEVNYMDNSFTKGVLLLETLALVGTGVLNVVVGCGHSNKGLVTAANGLLGLGGGPLSLPTQLWLHGMAWIPLLRNPNTPTFYYVGLSDLGIGDVRLLIPENTFKLTEKGYGGVIIDSGTTFSHLPTPVYEIFRDTYVAKMDLVPILVVLWKILLIVMGIGLLGV
ncbi:hypothetical protein FH972_017478 [Carpinus fangiana]|uniref:Peptidase A1 domain-containing protein n=1 Tax=Carpinus fangiana TaxID=176857 RepID=A0A5N6RJJ3_9ROSI|nr:hypothetical protein FH972_017478 [Carpinus fangiana]